MCGHCGLIFVFGTEVDVDKFGVRLSRGEETGWNCKEIMCLKKEEGWLEWDVFVSKIGVCIVRLDAVLKGN